MLLDGAADSLACPQRRYPRTWFCLTTCIFPQLPDPNTIRPLDVLKQTLELLKRKWREESNYNWVCDQFKSMRQDLIVRLKHPAFRSIRSPLT